MVVWIWLGLICCGVANGLIYSKVVSPDKYIYMMVVALVCFGLIVFHRLKSKPWCNMVDYDEDFKPLFLCSFPVAIVLAVITGISGNYSWAVGCSTVAVTFLFVGIREAMYVGSLKSSLVFKAVFLEIVLFFDF